MKYKFCLVVFLFLLVSCEKDWLKNCFIKDKEFSIKLTTYTENELRIDGYYYRDCSDNYSHIFVFYANGVRFGGSEVITTIDIEDRLRYSDFTKRYDRLSCWGPFEINNNVLRFEFYDIFGNNWHTCIAHCKILNDTIFNIEKITFSKTGEEVNVDRQGTSSGLIGEFRFKQFSPKPDSTNNFIK